MSEMNIFYREFTCEVIESSTASTGEEFLDYVAVLLGLPMAYDSLGA